MLLHLEFTYLLKSPFICPGINNNNNYYYYYLLQMGCHPVAVIILHVFPNTTNKFTLGGLHEKHVVSTWKDGNHLSICF
jgi:hypothetical protein